MRSFIAIETTNNIRRQISSMIQEIRDRTKGVKWVRPENAHVTMYFLGDIIEDERSLIEQIVQASIEGIPPFTVSVDGISGFPRITSPRVLWAGVQNKTGELHRIHDMLIRGFKETDVHIKPERSGTYTPHITIGRVKWRDNSIAKALDSVKDRNFGVLHVEEVVLFKSTLTREGPVYERLSVFPLKLK
jgi:2'-5' RNA ligase